MERCHYCQTRPGTQLLECVRCRTTLYCDEECQKADWVNHKPICRPPESIGLPVMASDGKGFRIKVTNLPHHSEKSLKRFKSLVLQYWTPDMMKFHCALQFYDIKPNGDGFLGNNEDVTLQYLIDRVQRDIYNRAEDGDAWKQQMMDYEKEGAVMTFCVFRWLLPDEMMAFIAICLVKNGDQVFLL